MGYRVRCPVTNEWGNQDTFYHPEDASITKRYFKSKEIYEQWLEGRKKEEEYQQVRKDLYKEFLGYSTKQANESKLCMKEYSEIEKMYPCEIIKETVNRHKSEIHDFLSKNHFDDNDYRKMKYIIAMINNRIKNVYVDVEEHRRLIQKRANMNIPDYDHDAVFNRNQRQDTVDMSSLFEGEDW